MGKVIIRAPVAIRKVVPEKKGRGRPKNNPGDYKTTKFIMTLSAQDFSDIAEKAIERGCTVQQYIRMFIVRAWRESGE